jgi:uncharacterized SAM-binding protein YcdF (DUF218 family)
VRSVSPASRRPDILDIVVLGRRLEGGGRPGDIFRRRLDTAAEVYRSRKGAGGRPRVVITGGDLGGQGVSEARSGWTYLREEAGLPAGDLVLEEKALDTVSNAVYSKLLLLESGCRTPVIVSSCYHIPRVSYIFSHILGGEFEPTYVSAPTGLDPAEYRRHWHSESMKMIEAVNCLDGLDAWPGDHRKVVAFLREKGLVVRDTV